MPTVALVSITAFLAVLPPGALIGRRHLERERTMYYRQGWRAGRQPERRHRVGFTTIREAINAVEAWLGGLPGHDCANVRQPVVLPEPLGAGLPVGRWTRGTVRLESAAN